MNQTAWWRFTSASTRAKFIIAGRERDNKEEMITSVPKTENVPPPKKKEKIFSTLTLVFYITPFQPLDPVYSIVIVLRLNVNYFWLYMDSWMLEVVLHGWRYLIRFVSKMCERPIYRTITSSIRIFCAKILPHTRRIITTAETFQHVLFVLINLWVRRYFDIIGFPLRNGTKSFILSLDGS